MKHAALAALLGFHCVAQAGADLPRYWKSQQSGHDFSIRVEGDRLTWEGTNPQGYCRVDVRGEATASGAVYEGVGHASIDCGNTVNVCRFRTQYRFLVVSPSRIELEFAAPNQMGMRGPDCVPSDWRRDNAVWLPRPGQ